jgi:hypothetical protein
MKEEYYEEIINRLNYLEHVCDEMETAFEDLHSKFQDLSTCVIKVRLSTDLIHEKLPMLKQDWSQKETSGDKL